MACRCNKRRTAVMNDIEDTGEVKYIPVPVDYTEFDLKSCYLCALKHVARAQAYFEEYHNGYPSYIKHITTELIRGESDVRAAFLLRMKVQAQLDMAAGELIGNCGEEVTSAILRVASRIREERVKLEDNPLYAPKFGELLVGIQNSGIL